jgi:uncharacterized protein (TIGR04141 family)
MSIEKITVYRVKDDVEHFDQFMRSVNSRGRAIPEPKEIPVDLPGDLDAIVEVRASYGVSRGPDKTEDDVPWLTFINERLAQPDRFQFRGQTNNPSGLLGVKIIEAGITRFFALTFGLGGDGFLNTRTIVRDFGLKVAMNVCHENGLKRLRTSIHEAVSTQSERQLSVGSSLSAFGINDEKEFLRSITGAADAGYPFIKSITGRDSVSIKIDGAHALSWDNIVDQLLALDRAYVSLRYQTYFPNYDKFHVETDKTVIAELDGIVFEKIRVGDFANIHLSPPDFIDFDTIEFSYHDDYHDTVSDITIEELLASRARALRADANINSIRAMRVYSYNVELNAPSRQWSAYQCLVAEVVHNDETFILSMGQWKRVSRELLDEVSDYLRGRVTVAAVQYLPDDILIWDPAREENREAVFNEAVAAASDQILMFDRARIQIAGEKMYEVCDLLHADRVFVQVKRVKSGSASVTQLFSQGRFYADAFVSDDGCRNSMREHIAANGVGKDIARLTEAIPLLRNDLITNQYTVVFCMLHDSPNMSLDDLPFMARHELMYAHRHIANVHGLNCEVAFPRIRLG